MIAIFGLIELASQIFLALALRYLASHFTGLINIPGNGQYCGETTIHNQLTDKECNL